MPPSVLVIAGLDPCGGAGISADIETLHALGCHAMPVLSALTVQDSRQVYDFVSVDPELMRRQLAVLVADTPPAAIKIGMLGHAGIVRVVGELLEQLAHKPPVVLDPILAANLAGALAADDLLPALSALWPHVRLLTPNSVELERLGTVEALLDAGVDNLLVTGGHQPGPTLTNTLYRRQGATQSWTCPRLAGEFHGSGCTLAAACAAGLAQGWPVEQALVQAQTYTLQALQRAWQPGRGQALPWR